MNDDLDFSGGFVHPVTLHSRMTKEQNRALYAYAVRRYEGREPTAEELEELDASYDRGGDPDDGDVDE